MGIRISKLPETKTINVDSDVIPIVQDGATKKILLDFVKHPDLLSVFNNNKGLSANWNSVFSLVHNLSSDWNSGNLNALYNKFLPLSGGKITGDLEVNNPSNSGITLYVENNKVGINTETPNASLTVVGNISASSGLEVGYGTGTTLHVENNRIGINTENPNQTLTVIGNIYASSGLEVGYGSGTTLHVEDNKVGINTESPNVTLTVVGSISANQNISAPTISSDMLKIGNSLSVTGSLGSVVKKIEIFDSNGTSLGFIPVYNTIS